ncbi:MAG: type II secretion system F family protein, partial [Planctomycetota bacterium]
MGAPLEYSYFYQAMSAAGKKRSGVRTAVDERDLSARLQKEKMLLLRAQKLPLGATPPAGLALKDEALLNQQVRVMLSRGVPLVEALEVASSVVSKQGKGKIERLREEVAAGAGFSRACESVGGFDDVTRAVYASAERTGDLAGAAGRLEVAAERRLALRGKTVTVMIYPAIILAVALLLLAGLMLFLIPTLSEQVRQINPELPWYSEIVFSTSEWMAAHKAWVFVIVVALVALLLVVRGALLSGLASVLRRVPGVSALLLRVEMSRFFSVMAAMTKSGVPLAEALGTSSRVISSPVLRAQLEDLQKKLVEGGVLRTLIEEVDELPLATRRLLIAADRSGDMDSAFDSLATATSEEVEQRSARLLAVLEPAMIVGVFAMIAP